MLYRAFKWIVVRFIRRREPSLEARAYGIIIGVQHDTIGFWDCQGLFYFCLLNMPIWAGYLSNATEHSYPNACECNTTQNSPHDRNTCAYTHLCPAAISSNALKTPTALFSNAFRSFPDTLLSTYLATTSGSLLSGRPIPTPIRHHFVPPNEA